MGYNGYVEQNPPNKTEGESMPWERLQKILLELQKVSDHRYGPGPTFWNDVDVTGRHPNKSELMKVKKESKKKK